MAVFTAARLCADKLSMTTRSPGRRVGANCCSTVSDKQVTVHRPINDDRGGQAVGPQRGDEGRRFPMTVGHRADQTLTLETAAVLAGHVGAGPGFVDEHQLVGIELGLMLAPVVAPSFYVRAVLLRGADDCLFTFRPCRCPAFHSAPKLTTTLRRSRSSSKVASGSAATN